MTRESKRLAQVDERAALESLAGDRDLLRELAQMFCEDAPQVMAELRLAMAAGTTDVARRAAHSLKGLAATFFAKPTVELAAQVEAETAGGQLDDSTTRIVDRLEASINALEAELRAFIKGD